MSKDIRIKKGVDIKLQGSAEKVLVAAPRSESYTLKPTDFHGVIPKMHVKVGDHVDVGTPVFYDKNNPEVNFVSPVSGEVVELKRGAKRKLLEIIIKADATDTAIDLGKVNVGSMSPEALIAHLLKSGTWAFMRQIPYAVIADHTKKPKAICVSGFNSAPLAADENFMIEGKDKDFQTGLDALKKLTQGPVYLNLNGKGNTSTVFTKATSVERNQFNGPHPAGNPGVQVHHLNPVNKGEAVWYIFPQDVAAIGSLLNTGNYNAERIVCTTGSEVNKPQYFKTIQGSAVKDLLKDGLKSDNVRHISGDVLTGNQVTAEGNISFYGHELTVIEEGNQPEFMGWMTPGLNKFSLSKTFLSWLTPNKTYTINTNLRGEERAYVVTGEYDKVLPMDIYPMHMIKAALIDDIDQLERLGIYEVTPEDFALCEFACTSKMEVQDIIRKALDLVKQECS